MIVPVKGRITSHFGYREDPFTHEKGEFHNGIDISCPENTPLAAPADGFIFRVKVNDLGGKQIVIKHPNAGYTGYAHLNEYKFKIGDTVKQGQIFALSGNTGRSTNPHLHFTMRNDDYEPVNPLLYFKETDFIP
jgi:murein DD-endopeptidase MepM/ murein hydrolase activator NlpD